MALPLSPEAQRLKEIIDFDKRVYFVLLVLIFLVIRYFTDVLVVEAIPESDRVSAEGGLTFFYIFNALNYLWTPFALLWKFTVISFLFWFGAFMLGYKVSYRELWQFALVAEVVFIFPELIRLLVYLEPNTGVTYKEIEEYRALSVLSLIGAENVEPQYRYALATINVFEVIYGVLWVYGFHMISRRSLSASAIVVLVSYFLPLAIWLVWYVLAYR
ncbi:sulfate ABC transporter permease [Algoriphagus sediminis]|uniref:Sulfate ABC transporter permease n=1 Tax=Algoriphagus sediminis TaxID=3057113 RepID=A0ABT7YA65_9BACT|nr:sulfate ABC transporter permease [Algoriphagus sediminis]MDN3203393.1 sulfate ABC transporter permease [Algoriphagus sediminis]